MTNSEHELEFTFAKNPDFNIMQLSHGLFLITQLLVLSCCLCEEIILSIFTRNSSGNEIANVNFLHDDIVHTILLHKFRHRSARLCVETQVYQIQ